jgi:hypothetical protein
MIPLIPLLSVISFIALVLYLRNIKGGNKYIEIRPPEYEADTHSGAKKAWKAWTMIGLLSVALSGFILKLILFFYLQGISPKTPDIVAGRTYPLYNHGYIFYVSRNQSLLQDILFYSFGVLVLVLGYLQLRWKIRNPFEDIAIGKRK